jgi:outer membrane protein OmpA-like peptidoglycan-associated protein
MSDAFYERIVPRTFRLERVDIDPRLLEPEPDRTASKTPEPIPLPEETLAFEKVTTAVPDGANPPRLDKALLAEKPGLPVPGDAGSPAAPTTGLDPLDDTSLAEALLSESPALAIDPSMDDTLAGATVRGGELDPAIPGEGRGFSNLDALLAETGPLGSETAPILMPADLLFDYDSHELAPGAVASLEKLGLLLRRNPQASFLIEGHTDSFGPDDYNIELSRRRAESVKEWLVQRMGIPASSVSTVGLGKARLIAPADGTIEEQQLNRRVEIAIRSE